MTTVQPESEDEAAFKNVLKLHKQFIKVTPENVQIDKLDRTLVSLWDWLVIS